MRLVLASTSPRRADLLEAAGFEFEVRAVRVDETPPAGLPPRMVAEGLAARKARACRIEPGEVVLSADTVGDLDGTVLGKPHDAAEAKRMLRLLSGGTHAVHTGVALRRDMELRVGVETTRVTFRVLTDEDIDAYVATGEPLDKAGAYAIQGGAADFVADLDGSHDNVVGLPLGLVRRMLEEIA